MKQQTMLSAREFQKINAEEKKKSKKPVKHEEKIQIRLCEYVRVKYPHVIFECDLASGTKLTIGQAVKAKAMRSNRGMPDFRIFHKVSRYNGLFLELKKEGEKLTLTRDSKKMTKGDYKIRKAGDWADIHIEEQFDVLCKLVAQDFSANFAIGLEDAIKRVDFYMKQ